MKARDIQNTQGIVFNIQKYSVHDGPGIRTVAFLKGCPLSCAWCSNPESQSFMPQLAYNGNNCISVTECLRCAEVCMTGALITGEGDKVAVNWQNCMNCLACTEVCPSGALITYGTKKTVNEVIDQVEEDATFYARSGGGLTLSGGEPLMQTEFALALLQEAKRRYINTAIETCGYVSEETLLAACKYCNTLMFDIKSMNSEKHKRFTGKGNRQIIENFQAVCETYPKLKIRVRTPVIPGFNDTPEDIQDIVDFISNYRVEYELLPYHRLGTQKYDNIGKEYTLGNVTLASEVFLTLSEIARSPALVR